MNTDADVLQYPYWNEPYRQFGLHSWFLAWMVQGHPAAYVCVLAAGWRPYRVGLVLRGPVALSCGAPEWHVALRELSRWAASKRFVFLRFTNADDGLLKSVRSLGQSSEIDAFPFYRDTAATYSELIIDQVEDDAEMLARFDKEIRRQIRRGIEAGYVVTAEDTPEAMEKAWPMLLEGSRRKGFRFQRTLSTYLEMVRLARRHRCVRIYAVVLNGNTVEVSVFFRSRDVAWNLLAARDPEALKGRPSPTPLMHWRAMRDMYREGVAHYNLGLGIGTIGSFKLQFRPRVQSYPPPVTLVLNEPLYRLWTRIALPMSAALTKPLYWLAGVSQT